MEENGFWFQYSTSFESIKVVGNNMMPTLFDLKTEILSSVSQDSYEFNFSILKLKHFFEEIISSSILFSKDNQWAFEKFFPDYNKNIKNEIVLFPFEPSEEVIVNVFKNKIEALSKNVFAVSHLELISNSLKGISFSFIGEGIEIDLPDVKSWVGENNHVDNPWWLRNDGSTYDVNTKFVNNKNYLFDLDFLSKSIKPEENVVKYDFKPKVIVNDTSQG